IIKARSKAHRHRSATSTARTHDCEPHPPPPRGPLAHTDAGHALEERKSPPGETSRHPRARARTRRWLLSLIHPRPTRVQAPLLSTSQTEQAPSAQHSAGRSAVDPRRSQSIRAPDNRWGLLDGWKQTQGDPMVTVRWSIDEWGGSVRLG